MSKRATLYGINYSPWTERARWALDARSVPFRYRQHIPFLGEAMLRRAAKGATGGTSGKVTVPLLRDGMVVLGDSFAIMKHAEAVGTGPSLRVHDPEVAAWIDRMEPALQRLRVRGTRRILSDPEALREAASAAAPGPLATLAMPVAAQGARFLARKYGFDPGGPEPDDGPIRDVLTAIREALGEAGADGYILGDTFSAADIVASGLLQGVKPVDAPHIKLGSATRRAWSDAHLIADFGDLVAWRDRLYRAHRAPQRASS